LKYAALLLVLVIFALSAVPLGATDGVVVIPAAISAPGAHGTQWESDFRFFNPCGSSLRVWLEFIPENVDASTIPGGIRALGDFIIAPNETRVFNGIYNTVNMLGGPEFGGNSGSLRVWPIRDRACNVVMVSRTFNDTPEGTFGLTVPAMPAPAPTRAFLDFPGLLHSANYRSNLRLVNFGNTTVWVELTAVDGDGSQVGEARAAKVMGGSTKQINDVASWLGATGDQAPFTVRVDVNGREIDAVATVVDNQTGDSVLYLSSYSVANRAWLVGAASLSGVNESQWRTDLWLYNPTGSPIEGKSEFIVGDDPSQVHLFGWPSLQTHKTQQYLDLVSVELGLAETRGYVVLTGNGGGSLPQVAARTYNLDPLGGTSGLNLRAYLDEDLLQPGEAGYFPGVSHSPDLSSGFRSNLGFINTSNGWTTVRITIFNLDGSVAAGPFETNVAPSKMRQFNVFDKLGLGDIAMTGTVMFEVVSGGAVAAYITEINNRTQDSIFIPAQ
jgi:hypothetical protein